MKAIINMTTAFLLLLMFLFGWSLVTYNEDPQRYQWLDSNGEFKTSSYDLTVSYNLNTPLDELNGYSLNAVFYDYNFFRLNSPNNIYGLADSNSSYLHHQYIVNIPNGSARVEWTIFNSNLNDNYFIRFEVQSEFDFNNNVLNASVFSYRNFQDYQSNDREIYYDIVSVVSPSINRIRKYNGTLLLSQYDVINYYNMYLINLTDLGIDNLTDDDMYYWYSEYQRLQENQIENYKELGSTVESSWQFLVGYFNELGDVIQGQVNFVLDTLHFISGVTQNIITVPIFG